MIREHTHIALVRDASETVLGMITLEDIIEELVGEIHDEYDRLPAHYWRPGPAGSSAAELPCRLSRNSRALTRLWICLDRTFAT